MSRLAFMLSGISVVAVFAIFIVWQAGIDKVRDAQWTCVEASLINVHGAFLNLEQGESVWDRFADACDKAGNPATGV